MMDVLQEYQGEYEWMLYGHDDTFFFLEGVMELLQDFDPRLPYIITGQMLQSYIHCTDQCQPCNVFTLLVTINY